MKRSNIAAAKKTAKKAVKKAAVKKAPAKKAAVKVATKKVAKKATKKVAAKKAVKTTKKANSKTTIVANVDVGFGNALYLRGSGNGLSWAEGIPMDCKGDSAWSIEMSGITTAFEFKVLINDEYWSAGYNEVAEPGTTTTVSPSF